LGQVESPRVEADETALHTGCHRLRRLGVKVQAERRLPGLQRRDQIWALLADQTGCRQFEGGVLGRRPVEQAGITAGLAATDEHRLFAWRPDV
jgi:hypothetical protein